MLAPGTRPLLPMPMVNILSGGAHAGRALDVQDIRRTALEPGTDIGIAIDVAADSMRLARGIDDGIANAVLVKPNQTGTVSAAHAVGRTGPSRRFATVLSARSGETEDSWLADLAVGWRTGQIKVGSTMRSERTAKWNRHLRIETDLGADAQFAGAQALAPARITTPA